MESPVKGEIKAEVDARSVDKLVDAVVDAFSPATETLGLLGDAVRLARVDVAAKVTRRAKAIADENGLRLTAPPLKFLVPFYEKASVEDAEDETLMEMWARLLAAAGTLYEARYQKYTAILSEMSSEQARLLNVIMEGIDRDATLLDIAIHTTSVSYPNMESRIEKMRNEYHDCKDIMDVLINDISCPGNIVFGINVFVRSSGGYTYSDEKYNKVDYIEMDILRSHGLISMVDLYKDFGYANISISYSHITELGFDFWCACKDVKQGGL